MNVIEYWLTKDMDSKEFKKIENIMNGPRLEERLVMDSTPQTMQTGPIKMPDWWDDGDDSSIQESKKIAQQLSAR